MSIIPIQTFFSWMTCTFISDVHIIKNKVEKQKGFARLSAISQEWEIREN